MHEAASCSQQTQKRIKERKKEKISVLPSHIKKIKKNMPHDYVPGSTLTGNETELVEKNGGVASTVICNVAGPACSKPPGADKL